MIKYFCITSPETHFTADDDENVECNATGLLWLPVEDWQISVDSEATDSMNFFAAVCCTEIDQANSIVVV